MPLDVVVKKKAVKTADAASSAEIPNAAIGQLNSTCCGSPSSDRIESVERGQIRDRCA